MAIRVLHVLAGLNAGGMESMIMNYYRNIDKSKVQFDFLLFSSKSFYDDEALKLGSKIFRVTSRRENFIKNRKELDDFFANHPEYKIIHVHQGINYFLPLKKANKYNVPCIIAHSHGMDPKLVRRQGIFFNLFTVPTITRLATDYVACSDAAVKQIFGENVYIEKKYKLIKNAINIEDFKINLHHRQEIRRELGAEKKFIIGHIGNFTHAKNYNFIVDVFYELNVMKQNSLLVLVGTGDLEPSIRNRVEKLNLNDKVVFLGLRKDTNKILQAMDSFIFPSIYEGIPLAMIEAQAAGLKVFASENIDSGSKASNLVEFISLNKSAKYWANEIISKTQPHSDVSGQLTDSNFNITVEAKSLEDYYLKLSLR